ncbi:hypothetical protein PV04_09733 [Phialophora macrospora]|uniref:Cytochrome P450 n=1 Tax=Phialophora macrospora TaxID=1851006 RepID=A0A0D2CHX9_9EURO|nr:hypothetical protein PV04_09733 [Phialophora macrospora]
MGLLKSSTALPLAIINGPLPVAIILLCVAAFLLYRFITSPINKLAGPWHTKLTSLGLIYHEWIGMKRLWLHGLHQKYGPIVRVAPNQVSFTSATSIKEIYASAGGGFPKTEVYLMFKQGGYINLFTALDHEEHSRKKRIFADRYSNSAILKPKVLAAIRDRARAFVKECTKGPDADIYLYLHCYALDCVSSLLFHPYNTRSIEAGEENEMVQLLTYHDTRKALLLESLWPPLEKAYSFLTGTKPKGGHKIDQFAWSAMQKTGYSDFTLADRLRAQKGKLSLPEMVAESLDHIGAGIATTADTLCSLMWELSLPRNADRVKRLREEVQSMPEDGPVDSLPYLEAVMKEGLRCFTPGTLPFPRYVPARGASVDGVFLPGGTVVSAAPYSVHRDPVVFPNPDDFIPERWLEEEGSIERNKLSFWFLAGAHTCIGKYLALAEMRTLLHMVYSNYWTRPSNNMHACMEMDDQFLTSRPKDMLCLLTFENLEKSGGYLDRSR